MNWTALRSTMTEKLRLEDIRDICFDNDIDYEDLSGNEKSSKIRSLLSHCKRHDLAEMILSACAKINPNVDWELVAQVASEDLPPLILSNRSGEALSMADVSDKDVAGVENSATQIPVRIFLAFADGLEVEQEIAFEVIKGLQYDAVFHGTARVEVYSWDNRRLAILEAEHAKTSRAEQGLSPADCDIVLISFWTSLDKLSSRLASNENQSEVSQVEELYHLLLKDDTKTDGPLVALYYCERKKLAELGADNFLELHNQMQKVLTFLEQLSANKDEPSQYNRFEKPDQLRQLLKLHLRTVFVTIIRGALQESQPLESVAAPQNKLPLWQGSPFPGLRSFTTADSPIYFGREREADELVQKIAQQRFVIVIGGSGSGKSSLVSAGAIPRLFSGALPHSHQWMLPAYDKERERWQGMRFTPGGLGNNPFVALAVQLAPLVQQDADLLATELFLNPAYIGEIAAQLLESNAKQTILLIFIDQLEELLTIVAHQYIEPFIDLIVNGSQSPRLRIVATMRSDFYHRFIDFPSFTPLLDQGQFPLSSVTHTFYEMISRPAERAGLTFEDGLIGRIVNDTNTEPGALPLLAYTLDELYRLKGDGMLLTHAAYDALGGVQGAIGTRAEDVFVDQLDQQTQDAFSRIFRSLTEVNEVGQVTRRRARFNEIVRDQTEQQFIDVFTEARLLVQSAIPGVTESIVEVAHEALFSSWQRLKNWADSVRDDLQLLNKVNQAAQEWWHNGQDDSYLWLHERLLPVYEMAERLNPNFSEETREFIRPEADRLFPVLLDPATELHQRQVTADRLYAIGDSTIEGLIQALHNELKDIQAVVRSTLVRFGGVATYGLKEELSTASADLRLMIVGLLQAIGGTEAALVLLETVQDGDVRVRSAAVGGLEQIATPDLLPKVMAALESADVDARWRMAGKLGAFGSESVPNLLQLLEDEDEKVRAGALQSLELIGVAGVDYVVEGLRHPPTRNVVAELLVTIGDPAVAKLAGLLKSTDVGLQITVLEILHTIANPDSSPPIEAMLQSTNAEVRFAAASALGAIADPASTDSLIERMLRDADLDVRQAAQDALTAVGEPAIEKLSLLCQPQKGRTPADRLAAVNALADMGSAAAQSTLIDLLTSRDKLTRLIAANGLINIGDTVGEELLTRFKNDPNMNRESVARVLANLGETVLPHLLSLYRDVQQSAAEHQRGSGETITVPQEGLEHLSPRRLSLMLCGALRGIREPETLIILSAMLASEHEEIRMEAANSLAVLGEFAFGELLRAFFGKDERQAAAAYEGLKQSGAAVVPLLLEERHNQEGEKLSATYQLLREIGSPLALLTIANEYSVSRLTFIP